MGPSVVLLAHSLRRHRPLVLALGAILAFFQILLALGGRALQETGMLGQIGAILPPFVREMIGPALATVMSYAGVAAIGYFHVVVTAAVVGLAIALGTEPAGEVESGFADLVLARPVARRVLVVRSAAVVVSGVSAVVAAMLLGTWIGSICIAPSAAARPGAKLILSLGANLWALALCWGGVGLAIASASRRRSVAGASAGLAALALFLLDYLGKLWRPARLLAWLSPFHYYNGLGLLARVEWPGADVATLLAAAAASAAVGIVLFLGRDV